MGLLMKVRKIIDMEAPGLGAKIKAARKSDNRSLISICKEIELTPMYWYKIEAEEVKVLPVETLNRIEKVLGIEFGVKFD